MIAMTGKVPTMGGAVCSPRSIGQRPWAPGIGALGLSLMVMAAPSAAHAELNWPPGLPKATCDVVSPVPSPVFNADVARPTVSLYLPGLKRVKHTLKPVGEAAVVERIEVVRSDGGRRLRIERRRQGESVAFAERQVDKAGHCLATSQGAGGGSNGQRALWYGDRLILRAPWASGAATEIRQSFEYRGRRVVRAVEARGPSQVLVRTIQWAPDFRKATISARLETLKDGWKTGPASEEGVVTFDAGGRPIAGGQSQEDGWTRRYDAAGHWVETRVKQGGKVLKYTARWSDPEPLVAVTRPRGQDAWRFDSKTDTDTDRWSDTRRLVAVTRPTGQTAWRFDNETGQLIGETDTEQGVQAVTSWTWKGTTLASAAWERGDERQTMTLRWRKGRLQAARFERRVSGRVTETRRATYRYVARQ